MKAACWFRTKDGELDWAEDCVGTSREDVTESCEPIDEGGYGAVPLYAIPEGWVLVPRQPTEAMLRPFTGCPDDELRLAWETMLHIVLVSVAFVDRPDAVPSGIRE